MVSYQNSIKNKIHECIVFVAIYDPVGNIPGKYQDNVLPIIFWWNDFASFQMLIFVTYPILS